MVQYQNIVDAKSALKKCTTCNKPGASAAASRLDCFNNLLFACVRSLLTSWQSLVDYLLQCCWDSTELLQVVPTTCCCHAIQQLVNKLQVQTCSNLIKLLTTLLQACCKHILLKSCDIFTCVHPGT